VHYALAKTVCQSLQADQVVQHEGSHTVVASFKAVYKGLMLAQHPAVSAALLCVAKEGQSSLLDDQSSCNCTCIDIYEELMQDNHAVLSAGQLPCQTHHCDALSQHKDDGSS
jgi:hypothetical protein